MRRTISCITGLRRCPPHDRESAISPPLVPPVPEDPAAASDLDGPVVAAKGSVPGDPARANAQDDPAKVLRPGRPGEGGEQWRPPHGNRPSHIDNWNQWNNWRGRSSTTKLTTIGDNNWNNYSGWYDRDWWNRYPNVGWRYPANFNYWGWAAWPVVTSWFPWGWTQPVYYSYGDNVYYEDDQVYYGDAAGRHRRRVRATGGSDRHQRSGRQAGRHDWMPLGVFAVTPDGEPNGAEPTLYLQLAVSKQGIISGTLQNTATDKVQPIEGMVDKQTQRAAWTVQGQTRPIMETGIGNLTQDTAPALVHFADGSTQQWLLVRLDKPTAGAAAPATPPQPN